MKKIGILFGQEHSFPPALVERINQKTGGHEIMAEAVRIDKVMQGEPTGYDVVIDRISQDVPFYRAWLKNEALTGCAVVNNPFWWSADEKFFNNALATKIGVAVPKTVLLPSHQPPPDTNDNSFRNLAYPLDWDAIFAYVGWPAYFKPFAGGGWKNVYKLHNPEEFYRAYSETGQLVMMLQEEVTFDMYFRCYCVDQRDVKIMNYEPRHPYHLRYVTDWKAPKSILETVEWGVLQLNQYLGYDLNTVEFAIRDGVPVAIDFCNPAPDAERSNVGEENFQWILEAVSEMAIGKAREHVAGRDNLSWGKFMQAAATHRPLQEMGKASISEPPAYSPEGEERPDWPGSEERAIHEI
ncbi:MAG: hypothetical protein ABI233_06240 [Chthoniobacterales bacterium]